MKSSATKFRYPFYVGITTLIVTVVLVLSGVFFWISRRESTSAAIKMADQLFVEVNQKIMERYQNSLASVAVLAGASARMPGMATLPEGDGQAHPGMELMFASLNFYDYLLSLYCGYEDGSFIQVTATRGDLKMIEPFGAPRETYYVLRTISMDAEGGRRERRLFLNAQRKVVGSTDDTAPVYDPRKRDWYQQARQQDNAFFTDPYLFNATQVAGVTCAKKLVFGSGVIGADITLQRFSESLRRQKVSENGTLFLFDHNNRIIAHPTENPVQPVSADEPLRFLSGKDAKDPLVRLVTSAYRNAPEGMLGQTQQMTVQGHPYLVRLTGMKAGLKFDQILVSMAPLSDFTGHIRRMQERVTYSSLLVIMLVLPLALIMSRKISASLTRLEQEAYKVQQFDFSPSAPFDSRIKEIHANIRAFVLMKTTIRDRTDDLIATQKKLETLVQSGIALSAEQDTDRLLRKIFDSARMLSNAEHGRLYLRDDNDHLQLEIMLGGDNQVVRPDKHSGTIGNESIPIGTVSGESGRSGVESHVAFSGETVVINDTDDSRFDLSKTCELKDNAETICRSYLTAPLKTREGNTIGVLQVLNARDEKSGDPSVFSRQVVGFVEALASQAAVALHNKRLMDEQRALFDAFIQLIAGAIDAKSPYTGGHCARVPVIATMLAKAAHAAGDGLFADFRMETEDEWREFNVAAWLHDCGKVTTPEYVVDKATKLETIYDRIHEIRMRFEVLLRDVDIDYYQAMLEGSRPAAELAAEREKKRQQIAEDYAFVAECNVGGEFMADEKIARLEEIAQQTWKRHLNDRIGISEAEAKRKTNLPEPELPVFEQVLADRSDHIISRDGPDPFGKGNPYAFKMEMPSDLYNLGEIYNLSIRKGTLAPEDRFKINEHIIQTLRMLKKLPFPKYLKNVAEIAACHHETMDGKGYPRRLTRADMSIPARIMAIADIFEALTASDRPYKKAKTMSASLRIMSFMRNDSHIDAELFDLFLKSGVYIKYAREYLKPEQVDEVDITALLSGADATKRE